MCGIFGIVYRDGDTTPAAERLQATLRLIEHRGPDGSGVHAEAGVGLAHTRLSLVDLSDLSLQPFWDVDRRFCLVYNGEIYNFKELRAELEAEGARFRTTGDTEVLLQSLMIWGPEKALPRLEGMFAFGLYDRTKQTLLLARDRFGIKPLSVYQNDDVFVFASEIKAMRPWVPLRPNPLPITSYLLGFGGPTKNASFYDGVRILPPGAVVTVQVGEAPSFSEFMTIKDLLDPAHAEELSGLGPAGVVDRVDELLRRSVKEMLFADAPVGALCSGGVDSSILMAMAARQHKDLAIFHANVKGPQSEYDAAARLARHLGLDLQVVDVFDQDFIDMIPEVTYHYEHPFEYHPNSVPFIMVSKLVREHGVKGVLSGEGADECFLGYDYLAREPFEKFYRAQLGRLGRAVRRIPKLGNKIWPYEGNSAEVVKGMLSGFERELEEHDNRAHYAQVFGEGAARNVRTADLLGYHLRTLLHRNDCLGMAASIEARFPFLDERVVSTAVNLPYANKIRFSPFDWNSAHPFLRDKWVLRMVADRYLPKELSRRKKLGFAVTAFERLRIPPAYFRNSFLAHYFGLANREADFLADSAEQSLLVDLLLLDVWGEMFIAGSEREGIKRRLREHVSFAS